MSLRTARLETGQSGGGSVSKNSIFVLMVGEEQQYWDIKAMLLDVALDPSIVLYMAGGLEEELMILNATPMDAILLILTLTGNQGDNAILKVRSQTSGVPVVVIVESEDMLLATQALRGGVQDVLIRQELTPRLLARSLRYAIERQGVLRELQKECLSDELTGLYNRRGFMNFARHHVQVANRCKWGMILFYADLDHLKWINDNFGHQEGDHAITKMATLFKEVFRVTDIVARVGGDEFVALALDIDLPFAENILRRLQDKEKANSQQYSISLSVGFAYYDPANPSTIEELLDKADKAMYANKGAKKGKKKE